MIAVSNFVLLPLTFLSSVFMAQALMPGWMQSVARYNPVNWAVEAGRAGLAAGPDWGLVFTRMGWLALFTSSAHGWPRARSACTRSRSDGGGRGASRARPGHRPSGGAGLTARPARLHHAAVDSRQRL